MNLTKPQQLIYDMEKFSGGAIAMICGSMISDGEKDMHILKHGVNEIYRINEALRIRVSEVDGNVYQYVTDYAEQKVEVVHFESKEALDTYAGDYAKIPLDLYGNLCEIKIVVLPGQYGLLAKLHHIVGDAWTLALLGTQFHDIMDGKEVESYSYMDYTESEKTYIQSKRYEKDKVFFVEQFKKSDEVTYLNEKQSDTFKAERKTHVLDSEQVKQIMDYAKQHDTSPFILFTAALSAYMNRVKMNAEKFYIGTAVLNRNGVKEKNMAGMFINTVPMLIQLDNEKTFAQNLNEIQSTVFSVLRHQKYNYGDVLTTIRKEYGFQEKLYDVMISYQNAKVFGSKCETTWYHSGEQSESLQMHIDDRDNEGIFRIHYDYLIEKFTEHEIDRLHEHICNLLFDAIENDAKKIYELEILSAKEKNRLLYEFNDTAVEYPREKCVHQLFEEQVEKTPDAEYDKWYSLMSEEKKRHIDRLRCVDDRKRTVAGEMLARISIAEWCGVAEEKVVFDKTEYGKPFAVGIEVEFNISHSGNLVVCAVDSKPIGIDVEQIRPMDLGIAKRIGSEGELLYLFGDVPSEVDFASTTDYPILKRFFEIWTAKEAYGKCIGNGISCLDIEILSIPKTYYIFDGYCVCIIKS